MFRAAVSAAALSAVVLTSVPSFAEPAVKSKAVSQNEAPSTAPAAVRPAKRDPFKQEIEVVLPPPPPSCGKLCEFDLEQLRVAALVTGMATPVAGVEAPNGKVYVVDRGTPIGKKGGRVVEVANGKITVEEPCKRGDAMATCRVVLSMPADKQQATDENLLRR